MKNGHLLSRISTARFFAGQRTAGTLFACRDQCVRWLVRSGAHWRMIPSRFPAVGSGVSADATLAASRLLRGHGARPAGAAARVCGARGAAPRHDPRQPHDPVHAGMGARAGYDGAKRRKGSKGYMRRSIPWDICWPCTSLRPMSKTGRRWNNWHRRYRILPIRA